MMTLPRRQFLQYAAAAAALPVLSRYSFAASYPTRPVHWIVSFTPGGSSDILARLMGQWLSQQLGQQFVIENRPGAGTNIATEAVVRAAPDGYALLLATPANAINASLYDKLNFNFIRDIAPVSGIISAPNVMVVNPSFPAKTVAEFIAYAKANPEKINFASSGVGASSHLSGELFKMMTALDMVHVPYRGTPPAFADMIAGRIQVMFSTVPTALEHIRAGTLRAMATTAATRLEVLPDIPTVAEFVPGYESSAWWGVGAPAKTPAEIVNRLNKEINAGLTDPGLKARLADLGGTPLTGSPAEFGRLIAEETEKWGKVAKFAGLKPV
jgi:tripartite-type tricarboxylate transporter receptor subunit TctC